MRARSSFSSRSDNVQQFGRRLAVERLEDRAMLAFSVTSAVETPDSSGADDAAIWIHPTNPALSTIIGAIKTSNNALRVYDLAGNQLQSVASGMVNNVDLRYNFSLSGQATTLVTGSNRSNDSIVIYKVDPNTRLLSSVAARTISAGMAIYGLGMYVSPVTGKYYTFVTSEGGEVQQWELFDNGAGKVDATRVRTFSVGSQSEGIVADDILGKLYVGEEDAGIWKYSAEPGGGSSRTPVDSTSGGGHLNDDVEGLSIYYKPDGTGYLLASSQGDNQFAVYRREGANAYLGNFALVSGGGIDAVSDTDGIDVTNFPLGSQFPQGMFVAQDNDVNFKLARWDSITSAFGGLLTSDTSWDPRKVGAPVPPSTIASRQLFYNHSAFDGNNAAANVGDEGAIAGGVVAYRPGNGLAGTANVSSYTRGINGIIVDVSGNHGELGLDDFTFRVGNNNSPQSWAAGPAPASIVIRAGAGVGGSDRVHLVWNDGAIVNTWLEVIVEGNDALGGFNTSTGLAASDVFFFGSKVADSGSSPGVTTFDTTTTDAAQVFDNLGGGKPITAANDYNRDGQITTADAASVFGNLGSITRINIGAGGPFAPEADSTIAEPAVASDSSRSGVATALAIQATASKSPGAESEVTLSASATGGVIATVSVASTSQLATEAKLDLQAHDLALAAHLDESSRQPTGADDLLDRLVAVLLS